MLYALPGSGQCRGGARSARFFISLALSFPVTTLNALFAELAEQLALSRSPGRRPCPAVTPLVQIPSDPAPQPSPTPSARRGTSNFVQKEASLRRGIPLQRLLAGGMRYADAIALHSAADSGIEWADAGAWLGDRNLRLAQAASSAESQRNCLRFAFRLLSLSAA